MKLSWLASALLIGSGAAASTSSGKTLGSEAKLLLKKGIPYQQPQQQQQQQQQQQSSPSINSATAVVSVDKLTFNRTRPDYLIKAQHEQEDLEDPLPVVTHRITSSPEQKPVSPPPPPVSVAQTESSISPHHVDKDEGRHLDDLSHEDTSSAAETGNPASANRAIAGMGVGLVSVMLIFTVFL